MKTCVFTPSHETGILVAHIIPYAGSHDTRLGRESSWPQGHPGPIFFRPLMVKGVFCALTGRAAFLFRGNVEFPSFSERFYPLEQPVQRPDDCPAEEYRNRVQFRPQRQRQGDTGNADMHRRLRRQGGPRCRAVTTSKPTTAGAAPRPKCCNHGCCINRCNCCAAAAASAHGIRKMPSVAAQAPAIPAAR